MVVLIAGGADEHALIVKRVLADRHAEEAFILDSSTFPVSTSIDGRFGASRPTFHLRNSHPSAIALEDARSFWWRRPQRMTIDPRITDANAHSFAYSECLSALHGMLACCDGLWVNDIHRDDAADYKPRQLKTATQLGFAVPDTLITNDPARVRAFWDQHGGRVVYKPFNQRAIVWRPARLLRREDLVLLDNVRAAPVIFQAFVPGVRDLRVTIVGPDIFAAAFDAPIGDRVDYRLDLASSACVPHELPADMLERLRSLMAALRLEYAAVDLRLTPAGQYVFFELNTGGEFLFVQQRTGQPIADAVAAHLARGKAANP